MHVCVRLTVFFLLVTFLFTPLFGAKVRYPRANAKHGQYLGHPRDYYRQVTREEKDALRFIVTSLSNKSLVSVALMRSELEVAGDHIDQLHPLKFLHTVFTDEEMKVGIRNMRSKPWIWTNFMNGLKQSLITESNIGNITQDHMRDFASSLNVDFRQVKKEIDQKQWDNLVNFLIHFVPREGDTRRYD